MEENNVIVNKLNENYSNGSLEFENVVNTNFVATIRFSDSYFDN